MATAQRALVPISDRVGAPVDISYKTEGLERIRWMEGLVTDFPPPANQAKLHTYIQWLRTSEMFTTITVGESSAG